MVEPARRAGAPSRPPTGSPPTSSSPWTTTPDATCGGRPPRTCCAPLFLAAASSGRSLRECGRWLADAGSPIPAELLAAAGFRALAASLRGAQNGAPETRDGIYQTARTAAKCINDEDIMAWVAPPRGKDLPAFDPAAFAAGP